MTYTIRDKEYVYAIIETYKPFTKQEKMLFQRLIDNYKKDNSEWQTADLLEHLHRFFNFEELELNGDEFEL